MHYALSALYFALSATLIFFSYKSWRGGISYLNYFRSELAKPPSGFAPFCSIIAPCRGIDDDLEMNLGALLAQNFPAYEIIFVVDSRNDKAVPVIEKLIKSNLQTLNSRIIVAGKATGESQKIHNLREAVLHVSEKSEVFVFVDSDARPSIDWLSTLIAPLADEKIGAASGYRWFVQKRGNLATHLRSVWNASIASALGINTKSNFCWGGSLAIRRETFEALDLREQWRGTLSDDFVVTRTLNNAKLPIYFVPQALTATIEDCSFKELLEFTTRQMKITRVYHPHLWANSFIGSSLFVLVWIWGIARLFLEPINSLSFWWAALSLGLVAALSTGKSWLRLKAVKLVLKTYEKQLNAQFAAQNTLWILTPALFLLNCLCALLSRKISWRGIDYLMRSPRSTEILHSPRK